MVNFEDGQLVKGAYVLINGVEYPVVMPQYSGNTPLTSENLNKIQTDILNNLKEGLNDLFKFQTFTKNITIDGSSSKSLTMGALTIPIGYVYLGCTAVVNGYADQFLVTYSKYGDNITAMIHNQYVTQLTNQLQCIVMFIKEEYYNKVEE